MRILTCLLLALALCLSGNILLAANPGTGLKECKALEKSGKFEEALARYLELLKAAPSEELYRDTGSLLGKLQRYDEAEKLLKEATQAFPNSTPLLNMEALIAHRRGRTDEARAILKKVLDIDSSNTFARDLAAKLDRGGAATAAAAVSPSATEPASSSGETALTPEEQKKLAEKLYEEMIGLDKWETAKFEELHKQVIEKCPATDYAKESCWRLSNLYLMADDNPRYEDVIRVLEHLITNYPDSQLIPDAKNRLLIAYKNGGHHDKVVTMYQELFKLNPSPDDRTFMIWALEYADALSAVGKADDARALYEQVIEKDNGKDQLEARVARERLAQK